MRHTPPHRLPSRSPRAARGGFTLIQLLVTIGIIVVLVGLALQVPVALVAWVLARRLLRLVAENRPQRSLRSQLEFVVLAAGLDHVAATALPSPLSRGPPVPIPSR